MFPLLLQTVISNQMRPRRLKIFKINRWNRSRETDQLISLPQRTARVKMAANTDSHTPSTTKTLQIFSLQLSDTDIRFCVKSRQLYLFRYGDCDRFVTVHGLRQLAGQRPTPSPAIFAAADFYGETGQYSICKNKYSIVYGPDKHITLKFQTIMINFSSRVILS